MRCSFPGAGRYHCPLKSESSASRTAQWDRDAVWEVTLWPRCRLLKLGAVLVGSRCAHSFLVQDNPSSPDISLLSHPRLIALHSSQLCLCTHSKYVPSGARILVFLPAHSWDGPTRELISTVFLTAASSLEVCGFIWCSCCHPSVESFQGWLDSSH